MHSWLFQEHKRHLHPAVTDEIWVICSCIPRPQKRTRTTIFSASLSPPEPSSAASNPTTPGADFQALHSPPSPLRDASPDSTLALTVRHPSEVPTTPPASGAAMVIHRHGGAKVDAHYHFGGSGR